MDTQAIKLDLINWLIHLKDEAIIHSIQSIKDNTNQEIDPIVNNYAIEETLDNRLEEPTTDFTDARVTLNRIREEYGAYN